MLEPFYRFTLGLADANIAKISHFLGVEYTIGNPVALKPQPFMEQYLDLFRKMLLGFGLIFELPLLIMFLSMIGMVTHRSLWRFNRWAILLSFVVGAILTPGTDIFSQCLMAVPMVVLYNFSILIAWIITARKERAERLGYAGAPEPDDDRGEGDA